MVYTLFYPLEIYNNVHYYIEGHEKSCVKSLFKTWFYLAFLKRFIITPLPLTSSSIPNMGREVGQSLQYHIKVELLERGREQFTIERGKTWSQ